MFYGSNVAIVTPLKNGSVDEQSLVDLIEFHIENGTHGIVPCGTTGESPTLNHEEHKQVVKLTVDTVNGRIPVIAGTGSNCTEEAISLTQYAKEVGADGSLQVVPYYNKPTQEGLYRHFKEIASTVNIPIILYNIPGRSVVNLAVETISRLANDCKNIVGIKEASGSLNYASKILQSCGLDFILLSGEDSLNLPLLSIGAKGFITVTANILPSDVAELYNSFSSGDFEKALQIHYKLQPLNELLFIETNPIPIKSALSMMGKINPGLRLPLCEMSPQNYEKLKMGMQSIGLISK